MTLFPPRILASWTQLPLCGLLAVALAAPGPLGASPAQSPPTGQAPDLEEVPDGDFLKLGREILGREGPESALDFWEEAWTELASRGVHDPRVGVAVMEAAVALPDSSRRSMASELFLWSLTAPLVSGGRAELEVELGRIQLLLHQEDADRMESLRGAPDSTLARRIKQFWIERDPTPATPENERLLEHWERIVHARNVFTYARRPPLGTDERGHVYVRYGEPGRVVRGNLGASEHELQIRVPRDREARMRLRQYDPKPQYEVWVYDRLNESDLTYFLFGNRDGTGPFELVDGVHELILPSARSESTARYTPGGIPASYYLELFYYQELSKVGGYFGNRFSELDQLWNNYTYRSNPYRAAGRRQSPSESEIHMLTDRYRQEDEFFPPAPPLRPVDSDFEGRARDELVAQAMRVLSDDRTPLLVVVGASAPRLAAEPRGAYEGRFDVPGWIMRHSLIIRDKDLEEVGRLVQPVQARKADISSFVIRHVPEPLHLTLTAQTLVEDPEVAEDTLVTSDRLPGQVHIVPDSPLETDESRFEVSDLLTGTLVPPEFQFAGLPYPLLPARQLWIQDALRVYLEMYHMGGAFDGRARLDARFTVVPLREDGTRDEDREPLTLQVELTPRADGPYRETFDMQLRDQQPGRYRLEVEVQDQVRGQLRRRTADLELVG
jgi:GWxTD domain-containing protein